MAILAVAVLGLSQLAAAGHAHLKHGDGSLRAIQLAEHLMEEIASRPYDGSGATRADWCMGDYDGFTQEAGEVTDFAGTPYTGADASFKRWVSLADASAAVPELGGLVLQGRNVTVHVQETQGNTWQITRFIPAAVTP